MLDRWSFLVGPLSAFAALLTSPLVLGRHWAIPTALLVFAAVATFFWCVASVARLSSKRP